MSDRCYMKLTCLKKDRNIFEDMGFGDEDDEETMAGEKAVKLVDPEAASAHCDALDSLRGQGVPFVALSGDGIAYGCARHACDGNEVACCEATFFGDLYARIDSATGRVMQEDIDVAAHFLEVEGRAMELLGVQREENGFN